MSAHSFTPITVLEFTHGRERTMEMCKNYLRYCQGRESGGPPVAQTAPPATPPRPARGELVCPGAPQRPAGGPAGGDVFSSYRTSRAGSPIDEHETRAVWNSPWIGSLSSNAPPSLDLSGGWMPASLDDKSTEERKDEGPDPAWIGELERRLTQPTCPVDLFNEALAELKNLDPRNPYFCELHRQYLHARGALGYSRNGDGNYSSFAPCCIGCRFAGR